MNVPNHAASDESSRHFHVSGEAPFGVRPLELCLTQLGDEFRVDTCVIVDVLQVHRGAETVSQAVSASEQRCGKIRLRAHASGGSEAEKSTRDEPTIPNFLHRRDHGEELGHRAARLTIGELSLAQRQERVADTEPVTKILKKFKTLLAKRACPRVVTAYSRHNGLPASHHRDSPAFPDPTEQLLRDVHKGARPLQLAVHDGRKDRLEEVGVRNYPLITKSKSELECSVVLQSCSRVIALVECQHARANERLGSISPVVRIARRQCALYPVAARSQVGAVMPRTTIFLRPDGDQCVRR